MENNYAQTIQEEVEKVMSVMAERTSEADMKRLRSAYELAFKAHDGQTRKSGDPYIIHPIAVARIAAEELKLDVNSVMAAFLHDVVEDTDYTLDDMKEMFGEDVAYLVSVVTKRKKEKYNTTKQVDNYQQLLDSLNYDIRALMVKIADRLHNMRTLQSMKPHKQMKIAGETDYFYAPLANRLGLYDVKTDLENLSFHYRCPMEYADIARNIEVDIEQNKERIDEFKATINDILRNNGIDAIVAVYYRKPYSMWRKTKALGKDFKHIENKYYVRVTFMGCCDQLTEKQTCLRIYSLLTDRFKEKPKSFNNLIDSPKENSYQCLHVQLLSAEGIWEEVHICSNRMVETSKLGCMAQLGESNVAEWIERFKQVLQDIANNSQQQSFLESVATSLYYDDVMVFTPSGNGRIMPKGATAIDFAFELSTDLGLHAKYARINGKLCPMKTELNRGDCIEIGTVEEIWAKPEWLDMCCTYKAKRELQAMISSMQDGMINRCKCCKPIPGGDTMGIREEDDTITIHRRTCPEMILQASKYGDRVVAIEFPEDPDKQYPITVSIKAIDRYHLLIDIIDGITNKLHLLIHSLTTNTEDDIVDCNITFYVHSVREMTSALAYLYTIDGVDEVRQIED